jgi:hypothetical protein
MRKAPARLAAAYWTPIAELAKWRKNPRRNEAAVPRVARSIRKYGFVAPVVVWQSRGQLVAGHTRVLAMESILATEPTFVPRDSPGLGLVPVRFYEFTDDAEAAAYAIADNKLNEAAEWDDALLAEVLAEIGATDQALLAETGFDEDELRRILDDDAAGAGGGGGTSGPDPAAVATLAERFGVPPFTILDARQGYWQERKRAWLGLGIESEVGRGENLLNFSETAKRGGPKRGRLTFVAGDRPRTELDEVSGKILETGAGTSIFDPVLCELAYRWFCPPSGAVLDPFAGGSVRGIVAGWLGRRYTGIDLRAEQAAANEDQAARLFASPREGVVRPSWITGDSRNVDRLVAGGAYDLVWSCPPYADLERYSDDPRDLSTLDYDDFRAAYFAVIEKACALLRRDRFAAFVVGDVRDTKGIYRNFVGDTVAAFQAAGLGLYNEAILVTSIGSLAIRAGRQFESGRKLGKAHQNVLVFCKGDPRKATEACGPVDVAMPEAAAGEASEAGRYGEELR